MAESRNGWPLDLFIAVEDALSVPEHAGTRMRAAHVLQAIYDAGWHLVSTPTVTTESVRSLPHPMWGEGERVEVRCTVDSKILTLTYGASSVEVACARPEYREMRMRDLGSRFARQIGHAIGLPGCDGEVPF